MSHLESPTRLVRERRIVVCVGTGGVGKTTIAAALALEGARAGSRSLVLTIDPARRLADALGVGELGNEPVEVAAERRAALGIEGEGRLFAVMLDMKRTFDDLVERFAENEGVRERIRSNPIYQHVSDALAGSAEYAAMEKVYELCECGRFDLVVVDTPPAQHALDFLEAPQRLLEFLDSRLVHLLLHPALAAGRFGIRLFQRGAQRVLQIFERISGVSFLEDISEFLLAFEGMAEGFRERAMRVRSLLLGPSAGFLLIAGPSRESARNAVSFLERLDEAQVPVEGVVVNRVRLWPGGAQGQEPECLSGDANLEEEEELLARAIERNGEAASNAQELAHAAVLAAKDYASGVRRDRVQLEALRERSEARGAFFRRVPELPRDVHDLDGLMLVASNLFDASDAPQESADPSREAADPSQTAGVGDAPTRGESPEETR